MPVVELEYLRKKLEMRAGFLNPSSPFVYLNEDEDESFWNFKQNFIQLGVKTILSKGGDLEKLSTLLLAHEVSHTLNTDSEVVEKIDFPFPILNILEDARIEHLISVRGYDFHDLHQFSYESFYLENRDYENMIKNPYNIGVLLRWRKWRVEIRTAKPDKLTEEEYEEFLSDWERAIDDSTRATSTEEVVEIGKALYERWKKAFGETPPSNTCTGIEKREASFGKGERKDTEEGKGKSRDELGREPEDVKADPLSFETKPVWRWDRRWIQRTLAEIKRYLRLPSYTDTEYRMSGRRINPVRAENLLSPFRRKETITYSLSDKRLLIVIDGSGSMRRKPFYHASHTAHVLSKLFNTDIVITTTRSVEPIQVKDVNSLQYFSPSMGAGENYRSLRDLPLRYDFTLFLTDACINRRDWEYAESLSRRAKIGAGYVMDRKDTAIEDALRKVFKRYFYTKPDRVAVEVGLYIKRLFLRRA